MTDTTGGKGGVGIRLYVQGGEVARRTFDQVGDSGKKMWAQIALGDKAANPAIRALSAGVGEAKGGIDGLASRAGPATGVLSSFGAAGIAAAAGLGGLAIALAKAQDAMQWAAELTDTADRIGVGVERLQAWNFVADEAGVTTQALQANLEKLNGVLGAFKSGIGDAKLKPVFEELGITKEQLQNVKTADELMLILADTLGQVKDRALQVKFARSIGMEESLPMLRLGSKGIKDLADEAERLGLVMGKDVVKALDEADRKLELAQQRINSTVRLAVADLADDFANLIGQIAGAVVQLGRWDAQVRKLNVTDLPGRALPALVSDNLRGRTASEGEAFRDAGARAQPEWMSWLGFNQRRRQSLITGLEQIAGEPVSEPEDGGFDPQGHTPRGGSSRSNGDAERRQREREQALTALQRQELEAQRAAIQARFGPGGTEENALELARATITIDLEAQNAAREALRAQLEKAGALDEAATVRLEELRLAQAEQATARDAQAISERVRELYAERLRSEEASERDAISYLAIQERMAGTASERYEIGRRILEAEQALERKLLQAAIDAARPGDRGALRSQARDMARNQAAELDLFDHERVEDLRRTFKSYGDEVVQAIEDGRIGEYIGDRIKERLLDGGLNALFDAIGGGGKSGGGGFLSSLLGFGASMLTGGKGPTKIPGVGKPGRAAGGDVRDGMAYRMAEHGPELLLMGTKGHVTTAAETAKMVQDLAGTGGGRGGAYEPPPQVILPPITINAPGADPDQLKRVQAEVRRLNDSIENRVVETMTDYRQRTHGRG